jgi:hypothetical protein
MIDNNLFLESRIGVILQGHKKARLYAWLCKIELVLQLKIFVIP